MAGILNSTILDSAILVFPLKHTHTCQDWFPPFAQKKLHSHFPPQHLHKKTSLIHFDSLDDGSHLEFCHLEFFHPWIQLVHCGIKTPCFLLSDSLKNTLPLLWLWLKLIHSDSNSFILTQLDDGSHLEFCHLVFSHLSLDCSDSPKNILPLLWLWLKLIHSDSNSFILTELDDDSHLEFSQLGFSHLAKKKHHSFILT